MKAIFPAIFLLSFSALNAEIPSLVNYQGLLTDINGNVITGNKTVSVSVHDAATNGTQLYSEIIGSVNVQNGIYSFQFGSGLTFTDVLAADSQFWIQVTLDGVAQLPRERLVSVPFAVRAKTADIATSLVQQPQVLFVPFLIGRYFDPFYDPLTLPMTVPYGTPGSGTVGSTEGMYALPNTLKYLQSVTVKASGAWAGGAVQVRLIKRNMLTSTTSTVYSFSRSGVFTAEEITAIDLNLDWSTSTYIIEVDVSSASTSNTNDKKISYIKLQGN